MELKFILGMLIVMVGFIVMLPADKSLEDKGNAPTGYVFAPVKQRQPISARSYARSMVSAKEYKALEELIMLESSWNSDAQNKKSTAYGLGQLLDQTWEQVGVEKSNDYRIQLIATHKYVFERYGSWQKALEFRKANGYY
jgi:hypothetical protein